MNGNRNSANNWTVDGADNVDRGSNLTLMTFPSVDSIAEFKVERSLYTADTGRAGGAQINVVTKSGTSQFHGSLYEFVRNDTFAANNWFNNATGEPGDGDGQVPPFRWNDFGGTFGGPVTLGQWNKDKNKTFFFFSEEARRIHTYTTFTPSLPTARRCCRGISASRSAWRWSTEPALPGATVTQIPSTLFNPISAEYIKDIFNKLPVPHLRAPPPSFFPGRTSSIAGRKSSASTRPSARISALGQVRKRQHSHHRTGRPVHRVGDSQRRHHQDQLPGPEPGDSRGHVRGRPW